MSASFFILPLAVLVVISVFSDDAKTLWAALATGFVYDMFSPLPFGVHLFAFVATATLVRVMFLNFFTNRSIYAMILLSLIATVSYNLLWVAVGWLLYMARVGGYFSGIQLSGAWQLLGNCIVVILAFYSMILTSSVFGQFFTRRPKHI